MKFGAQLRQGLYPEWRFYYMDYNSLKRQLKERGIARTYKEEDEAFFIEQLERELDKVSLFLIILYLFLLIFIRFIHFNK
jgi:SPX domain protein involved in polyphosphate accumulation